ncbi:MAG TPA: DUF2157 domain-containing protein, partial [Geobacterales bacterium]|nr:DUF2157 domain-containing protein [Geobacterales bacterium]
MSRAEDTPFAEVEVAQQRVDRIEAFRDELESLEAEGILRLAPDDRQRVEGYHQQLLATLVQQYDVDVSTSEKQMSVGMRIISFLGAVALSCAIFFFFYRYWGYLGMTSQVTILITWPLLLTLAAHYAAHRERTLHFASILGLMAVASFVLNLSMLGAIFAITPSQRAFLAWGAFALILAYSFGVRLLLVAGIILLLGYLTFTVGAFGGIYWLDAGERPENYILAGIVLFLLSFAHRGESRRFPDIYRLSGLLTIFIALLVLAHYGRASWLLWPPDQVEHLYQSVGFMAAALTIWLGIRQRWAGITNLGTVFFAIFLYSKFFDWWWEWLPKWLFFLIIGASAVLLLVFL